MQSLQSGDTNSEIYLFRDLDSKGGNGVEVKKEGDWNIFDRIFGLKVSDRGQIYIVKRDSLAEFKKRNSEYSGVFNILVLKKMAANSFAKKASQFDKVLVTQTLVKDLLKNLHVNQKICTRICNGWKDGIDFKKQYTLLADTLKAKGILKKQDALQKLFSSIDHTFDVAPESQKNEFRNCKKYVKKWMNQIATCKVKVSEFETLCTFLGLSEEAKQQLTTSLIGNIKSQSSHNKEQKVVVEKESLATILIGVLTDSQVEGAEELLKAIPERWKKKVQDQTYYVE